MKIKFKQHAGMGVLGWIVSIPLILIGVLILVMIFFEARKVYWDHEVKRMCEEDGGATAFEKVQITQEEYKELGGINGTIPVPAERYKKNSPYFARTTTKIIREWDPEVKKRVTEIVKSSDGKIIGKQINYSRIGGGVSFWIVHPSSYSCRDVPGIELDVEKQIFIIDGEEK
jgi:hypothetical protein